MSNQTIRPIDSADLDRVTGAGRAASFTNNTSLPAFVSWLREGIQPAAGSTYHAPSLLAPGKSVAVPEGNALRAKAYGGGLLDRVFKLDRTLPGGAYKFPG